MLALKGYSKRMEVTLKSTANIKVKVDPDVAEALKRLGSWRLSKNMLAHFYRDKETGKVKSTSLIALVLGRNVPKGYSSIHLNGDPFDFRRKNIALVLNGNHPNNIVPEVTPESKDRSRKVALAKKKAGEIKYVGIIKARTKGKFIARLKKDGKLLHLGTYSTQEEAARAYDAELIKLGERPINFPEE